MTDSTVVEIWIDDEPEPAAATSGRHEMSGFSKIVWACHVQAEDVDKAKVVAICSMLSEDQA